MKTKLIRWLSAAPVLGIVLLCWGSCVPIPHSPVLVADDPQVKSDSPVATSSTSTAVLIIPRRGAEEETLHSAAPRLEWISPAGTAERIELVAGKMTIRVRATSPGEIQLNQLEVLVDGAPSGDKADEVNLLRRPEFEDQILTVQVPIAEGEHQVQVVLAMAADERYLTERAFVRDSAGVHMLENTPVTSATRVIWTKPDVFVLQENELYATKEQEMEVRFSITSPQPVELSHIRILLNQVYRLPSPRAQLRGENGSYYFQDWVTLDENVSINDIGLRVDEPSGYALSQRLKVNFSPLRPNLYVLAVGPKLNLEFSDRDAADFAGAFGSQGSRAHRLFNKVTLDTLIGAQATTQSIRLAIASIRNKLRTGVILEDDIVVLFFSTHGFLLDDELYLQANDYLSSSAEVTSIPYRTGILDNIEKLPCRKIVFIDACHAGGARANPADLNQALTDLRNTPQGLAVFASSSEDEQSYEDGSWKNGAFTEAILQGLLDGQADTGDAGNGNGIVTLSELEAYVTRRVPKLVMAAKQKDQHPVLTRNDLGGLPLFVLH